MCFDLVGHDSTDVSDIFRVLMLEYDANYNRYSLIIFIICTN